MFQFTWFDKAMFTKEIVPTVQEPDDFIILNNDHELYLTYWCEHCLECAAPECYGVCKNWVRRYDGKCKLYYYGIYKNNNFKNFPQAAQLKFRPWGKLRTQVSNSAKTYKKTIGFSNKIVFGHKVAMFFSKLTRFLSKRCIPNKIVDRLIKHRLDASKQPKKKLYFLLQLYSEIDKSYNFVVDMKNLGNTVKKLSLKVNKGYNQLYVDVSDIICDKMIYIEMYPENSMEAEIVILNADFLTADVTNMLSTKVDTNPAKYIKCVAWDLDNTLWDGILIESEPNTVKLKNGVLERIQQLDKRGIIQTIVSKNYYDEAITELKRLNIYDYFVAFRINWNPKSNNIRELAQELNINVNTFAFCDDSPFERQEVLDELQCVRVYKEDTDFLALPEFDVPITNDAIERRKMYQTELKRKEQQKVYSGDNIDFLKNSELVIHISKIDETEKLKRAHELVNRTNQLNLSGNRYDEIRFEKIVKDESLGKSLVITAKDKFGTYGQVAFLLYIIEDEALIITEYAMSCRVAKKYLESALFAYLAKTYNKKTIILNGINNSKNHLLIETLESIGFVNQSNIAHELHLVLKDIDNIVGRDIVSVESEI